MRKMGRLLFGCFLGLVAALAVASAGHAQGWVDVATVSSTIGNTSGHICVGGGRTDIGCGLTAPFVNSATGAVGVGTTTLNAMLDVAGTLKIANGGEACDANRLGALRYSGGSIEICQNVSNGWEPIATLGAGSLADRITSGTTQVITNGASNSISFTVGGVTTGYFYNGKLVANGVSTTGGISGTTGYFQGSVVVATGRVETRNPFNSTASIQDSSGFRSDAWGKDLQFHTTNQLGVGNSHQIYLSGVSGYVGIRTYSPSTVLDVSGTLKIASGGEVCDASRLGAIRYASGGFEVCQNVSNGWEPIATLGAGSLADRITSGTTQVITNMNASVTISTAGAQRMVVGASGAVGIGTAVPNSVLDVAGDIKLAGTGSEACSVTADRGKIRLDPVSGMLQACVTVP